MRDIENIAARLRKFVPQLDVAILPGAGHAVANKDRIFWTIWVARHSGW